MPFAQQADWNHVRQSLAEMCASYEEFDRFFSGVFDRLDDLAGELVRRQQTWMSQRRQSESELERQRAELAEQRLDVERQREQLAAAGSTSGAHESDERLVAEVRRLEQERDQFVQQQQLLEAELDTVRNRAGELAEELAVEQSQLVAERAEWNEELKRMRRVIETFTRQQAQQVQQAQQIEQAQPVQPVPQVQPVQPVQRPASEPQREPVVEASAPPAVPSSPSPDPVLGSVMAQFEMLQKDIAGRRKKKAAAAQ